MKKERSDPKAAKSIVRRFYEELWNRRDVSGITEILSKNLQFRGSLGTCAFGHTGFLAYVEEVCATLLNYNCRELDSVAEANQVFARMQFSGLHSSTLRGFAATGKRVSWEGAALFTLEADLIAQIWVIADLAALDLLLLEQREGEDRRKGPSS